MPPEGIHPDPAPRAPFLTTRWSMVVQSGDATEGSAALEELCRAYWPPVYAFVRRRGHSPEDAQDLTQEFFARMIEKNWLRAADESKGRFRTFLLTVLTRFLAKRHEFATARKRGGGQPLISLDLTEAEAQAGGAPEPEDRRSPESIYQQRWAETLLGRVLERLRAEFDGGGRAGRFDVLKAFLTEERGAVAYADAAARLGLSESAVKSGIYRLRQRYGELIREEIACTVASPDEVEEEIRFLLEVTSQ